MHSIGYFWLEEQTLAHHLVPILRSRRSMLVRDCCYQHLPLAKDHICRQSSKENRKPPDNHNHLLSIFLYLYSHVYVYNLYFKTGLCAISTCLLAVDQCWHRIFSDWLISVNHFASWQLLSYHWSIAKSFAAA